MSQEEQKQKQRFYFNWSLTLKTKSCFFFKFEQNFWSQKNLGLNKFWSGKAVGQKILPIKILCSKKFLVRKKSLKKILGPKTICIQIFFMAVIFPERKVLVNLFLGYQEQTKKWFILYTLFCLMYTSYLILSYVYSLLRKPVSSASTLAEHQGYSPGTLKPKNNV